MFKKGDFIRPKEPRVEGLVTKGASMYILLFNPSNIFIVYSFSKNHLIFQYLDDKLTYIEGNYNKFKLITDPTQLELLQALYGKED